MSPLSTIHFANSPILTTIRWLQIEACRGQNVSFSELFFVNFYLLFTRPFGRNFYFKFYTLQYLFIELIAQIFFKLLNICNAANLFDEDDQFYLCQIG